MNDRRDAILRVEELHTQFLTSHGPVHAVNGVSFEIRPGETLGLLGESGSGKSTIGLSMLRLLPPGRGRISGGRVLFGGEDLVTASEKRMRRLRGRDIAMIFQESLSALNPVYTIGEQIAEVIRQHERLDRRAAMKRAAEMLEMVGMPDPGRRLGEYPHELSGGMRQRVVIAAALACQPKLLIGDEPTTALDVTVQAQILDLIADIQHRTGMAVLFITHDLGVVAEIAHRAIVLYAGRVVEEADTQSLLARPRMPYTQGLLRSLPQFAKGHRLAAIPGAVPNPRSLPTGCAFHPRCQEAKADCAQTLPALTEAGDGRRVRCLHWHNIAQDMDLRVRA
ncbi:ABC transporter ATP-binding protein (plasmid) [Mesorhizobium mediterraneum]|uniref:Dipeptide ABC transporter ATP-binding protein DppD n=2 Tax=Mesorhizobium TaxID=68287 RepID=A0AB36R268_9HYPH|nr:MULTISPECIES: ABC transporter ATP-binding protein [Mesorhizobium]PAP98585.1 dipeptide ABC transporter ATP-binding protein DppD [Mesorhizobium mediterraneum]RWN24652.1 MAG: ABC transporter ATP-binding protein [Mesorhizobium sp.]RWN32514.1 MAG: ABC transporter ATP-binding protein [Mesorhizobium sp.]RWO03791.1 MAG: ABC transporter ATP-binding protein [Mesorhizobium sp.]RWO05058.1 MAG: ABC transporter ATP-binding protein [Mesorhizobium sp.]